MYNTWMYHRLGLSIHASDREVIRATRARFRATARRDPAQRDARKAVYRTMLQIHQGARQLAQDFGL